MNDTPLFLISWIDFLSNLRTWTELYEINLERFHWLFQVTSSVGVFNFESCKHLSQYMETLEEFVPFNRESWLMEEERRLKEEKWEKELLEAMEASSHSPTPTSNQETGRDSQSITRSRSMREQSNNSIVKEPSSGVSHSLVNTPLCSRHTINSEWMNYLNVDNQFLLSSIWCSPIFALFVYNCKFFKKKHN